MMLEDYCQLLSELLELVKIKVKFFLYYLYIGNLRIYL